LDERAIAALYHKSVGYIDLPWGEKGTGKSDGFGLSKLLEYHPEVVDNLQEILDGMEETMRSSNRVQLESKEYKAGVRLTWNKKSKTWLLNMFKKENSVSDNTTDTVGTSKGSKRNDTATPQTLFSVVKIQMIPRTPKNNEDYLPDAEGQTLKHISQEQEMQILKDEVARYGRQSAVKEAVTEPETGQGP
jgi:hypothetical protein